MGFFVGLDGHQIFAVLHGNSPLVIVFPPVFSSTPIVEVGQCLKLWSDGILSSLDPMLPKFPVRLRCFPILQPILQFFLELL